MSYKADGLGFSELLQVSMYFPSVYNTIESLIGVDNVSVICILQKTLKAFNLGLIEREV